MQTFLLEPRPERIGSPHWRLSDIPPTRVWVLAEDTTDARQRVTAITVRPRTTRLGDDSPIQPWNSDELVSCEPDSTRACKAGEVLTEDGRILRSDD